MTQPATKLISRLQSDLESERRKADANDAEHVRLLRAHWELLDEAEQWRRHALLKAARRMLT